MYDRFDWIFLSFKKSLVYNKKMTENNLVSSWSSGTRWAKCRATFAIELGSFVKSWAAKESKIPKLQILLTLLQSWWNRATKEFDHSVVNMVSSNSSAGVWDNNHSHKCKSFTLVYTTICLNSFASGVIQPLLLMYAQLHGWLYLMASILQY